MLLAYHDDNVMVVMMMMVMIDNDDCDDGKVGLVLEWVRMVSESCSWLATEQQEPPRLGSRPTARDFPQHLSISSLHQDFRDIHFVSHISCRFVTQPVTSFL